MIRPRSPIGRDEVTILSKHLLLKNVHNINMVLIIQLFIIQSSGGNVGHALLKEERPLVRPYTSSPSASASDRCSVSLFSSRTSGMFGGNITMDLIIAPENHAFPWHSVGSRLSIPGDFSS